MLQPLDLTQENSAKSTLGCDVLDGFLRGGFPCGIIAELTGEAAAGKTQVVLQSLLTVQLPRSEGGLAGKAVYIYTEGKPPVERLQSILANRFQGRSDVSLAHVLIEERPIATPEDLLRSVRQLEALLERESVAATTTTGAGLGAAAAGEGRRVVRLVAIDSVARVFRDDATGEGDADPQVQRLQRRAAQLFGLATLLKRLAQRHQLAVLMTNQVMDDFNDSGTTTATISSGGSRAAPLLSSGRRVLPALGLAWANCVNLRLFVARHDAWDGSVVRSLQVVFAPHLPHSYCFFRVDQAGVWGLGDEAEAQAISSGGGGGGGAGGGGGHMLASHPNPAAK
ncbi:hypothetical protein PLESTB_000946500 [Pleodorina starrii]|uniref:RecA family profile 1 domain-containing protein n=1 Tax=Pleodorina starrii TaxID=330485 RepID=A0A9W6F3F5_9CHLO|nr:hypothetical protein PLESTM_001152500 [Pleodorina starrii]GLC55123.1 hypothetical protein PLESTB_000946500 [Pleodorina starrii]GLC71124.1 hypothetical protein PLESTF_001077000 [Pleodorina starrii]